jgi:thiol-disulfide isomerase/thioredoxin
VKGLLAALAIAGLLASAAPSAAQDDRAVPLTVLIFHPDDGVDALGFSVNGTDPFAGRYAPLVAGKGRFDFPFFVADGVLAIEAIPDPQKPYVSALASYSQAVAQRAAEEPAAVLRLESVVAGGAVVAAVSVSPRADLAAEDLRLRLALVEDHVQYQPPTGLTNGVTDHRFTVRAYADLGRVAGPFNATHTFHHDVQQGPGRFRVAAWLQQDAPSPRFDAREVVQATSAPVGDAIAQASKGVLVEMLSATWCDPCLYGDRAVEQLAVDQGVAELTEARASLRYLDLRGRDVLAMAAAVVAGVLVVLLARRAK